MEYKMEIIIGIIAFVIGAGSGAGITAAVIKKKSPEVIVVEPDKTSEKQQETILQLTDLELAKQICEKTGGTLLCREILCLQFSRGIDSQTAGKTCEEISNIHNSITIMEECEKREDPERCLDIFWRRK
tara:strand:+ start:767 stop:1153 length:387 start_codon:yes stop_codon:yes gene_type:complete